MTKGRKVYPYLAHPFVLYVAEKNTKFVPILLLALDGYSPLGMVRELRVTEERVEYDLKALRHLLVEFSKDHPLEPLPKEEPYNTARKRHVENLKRRKQERIQARAACRRAESYVRIEEDILTLFYTKEEP